jgi:hypothetical protein
MRTGLHVIGWGLSRASLVLGAAAFAVILAYAVLVFVVVINQAAVAFGQ